MAIDVLVHIADDGHVSSEGALKAILEEEIRETKLPLGADVKVKREKNILLGSVKNSLSRLPRFYRRAS